MDILLHDIRYAARKLFHTPSFAFIAVTTLALAIGATTAIFSVVDGVLLKPLPFKEPERLVRIASTRDGKPQELSPLDFIDYRDQSHSFDVMAATQAGGSASLARNGMQAVRLSQARVGAGFFSLLGVQPELGRTFAAGEDTPTAPKVVVLSDAAWRTHFAADRRILGQTVSLDGNPYTVVGVAPPRFSYPEKPDIWVPAAWQPWEIDKSNRGAHMAFALGRVRTGIPIAAASRELNAIAKRLEEQYPKSNAGFGAIAQPLQEQLVGDVRPALYAMFGSVAFVLLIACANVANLLLVRAASRESEIAVRTALGAGRTRLIRQLVTESLLLSIAAAAIGAALAGWAVDAVVAFGPRGLPRIDDITIDTRALLFAALTAVVTGVLFGLVPAVHAVRPDISQMLRDSVRGTTRGGTNRVRSILVVSEMALAVVLLAGAGLLMRSFIRLTHVDLGYQPAHIVSFNVTLANVKYPQDRHRRAFAADLLDRLKRLPGTQAVAVAPGRPLGTGFAIGTSFDVVGRPASAPGQEAETSVFPVSADYFRTLGIPVVRGRAFTPAEDSPNVPPLVVVNQEFVRRYFKNEDPIGKRITLGVSHDTSESKTSDVKAGGEIVGVVGDVKQKSLSEDASPATYIPYNAFPIGMAIVVRSTAASATVEAAIRTQVREMDRDVPVYELTTMAEAVSESVAQPRFYTVLLGVFAGIALLLAALGIYGVVSYTVAQRTRELGIRIALGASHERVVRLVIGRGMTLTVAGVAIGMVAALALTRTIATLLFGVGTVDPPTFALVCVVLVCVAAVASWLPARRAAKVDPVIAMRAE
jgi:putative ABC transport system permease protein